MLLRVSNARVCVSPQRNTLVVEPGLVQLYSGIAPQAVNNLLTYLIRLCRSIAPSAACVVIIIS